MRKGNYRYRKRSRLAAQRGCSLLLAAALAVGSPAFLIEGRAATEQVDPQETEQMETKPQGTGTQQTELIETRTQETKPQETEPQENRDPGFPKPQVQSSEDKDPAALSAAPSEGTQSDAGEQSKKQSNEAQSNVTSSSAASSNATSSNAATSDSTLSSAAPSEATPSNATPSNATPSNATPSNAESAPQVNPDKLPGEAVYIDQIVSDSAFQEYLQTHYGKDKKYLSREQIDGIKELTLTGSSIQSLSGIEHFKNLETLIYDGAGQGDTLSGTVNLSENPNLRYVKLINHGILEIILPESVIYLDLMNNQLCSIDLGNTPNLSQVILSYNQFTELDWSGMTSLNKFDVAHNKLEKFTLPTDITGIKLDWLGYQHRANESESGYYDTVWFSDAGCEKEVTEETLSGIAGKTLYTGIRPIEFTVYYQDYSTSEKIKDTTTYTTTYTTRDQIQIRTEIPEREGYAFEGWKWKDLNLKSEGILSGETVYRYLSYSDKREVVLVGQWKPYQYTIIFDRNVDPSANETKTVTCSYGETVALPENTFTNEGFYFQGWSKTPDGEVQYKNGQNVHNLSSTDGGEVTLYAKWGKEQVTHTVHLITITEENGTFRESTESFQREDGSILEYGALPAISCEPWEDSSGVWYIDRERKAPYQSGTVTKELYLYAGKEVRYVRLSFDPMLQKGDSFTIDDQMVLRNQKISNALLHSIREPAKYGYRFGGWYSGSASDAKRLEAGCSYGTDTHFYAKWIPEERCILSFDTKSGSKLAPVEMIRGSIPAFPNRPERAGYTFVGWYATPQMDRLFDFDQPVNEDTTIYAGWKPIENQSAQRAPVYRALDSASVVSSGGGSGRSGGGGGGGSRGGGGGSRSGGGTAASKGQEAMTAPDGNLNREAVAEPGDRASEPAPQVYQEPLTGTWIPTENGWTFQTADQQTPVNAWGKIDDRWYVFDHQGYMRTGWYEDPSGTWYYMDQSGAMQTGWQQIGESWYYLHADGSMAHGTTIDGYVIGPSGSAEIEVSSS